MVGVTGFEPATSSTPRKRASRAAPHPDNYPTILWRQNGELTRIRTWDLRFRRPALYPAELLALSLNVLLLVPILAQSLLALVRSDLMPLSLPATGHLFYLPDLCPLWFSH